VSVHVSVVQRKHARFTHYKELHNYDENTYEFFHTRELQAQKNSGNDQLEEPGNLISTLEVISYKISPT